MSTVGHEWAKWVPSAQSSAVAQAYRAYRAARQALFDDDDFPGDLVRTKAWLMAAVGQVEPSVTGEGEAVSFATGVVAQLEGR